MTAKEYYNLLLNTSLEGGFPAAVKGDDGKVKCMYRTPDGKRCPIGLLINEKYRSEDFERYDLLTMFFSYSKSYYLQYPDLLVVPDGMGYLDLAKCRSIHDSVARVLFPGWGHTSFVKLLSEVPAFHFSKEFVQYEPGQRNG